MKKINLGLLAFAVCLVPFGKADTLYTFNMDTSSLIGSGQFALDFQLLDGSGLGDANNTVTITSIALGGGSPSGGGTITGGAAGGLASSVSLTDTAFFNDYYENFTPGTVLSFTIDTTNVLDGLTPDLFTVAILDSSLSELPTTGPASEFLDISLAGGASPVVTTYASARGSAFSLAAPTVQVVTAPAPLPESSNYWALVAVLLGLGLGSRVALVRTR